MLSGLPHVLNLATASGENLSLTSDIVTDALTAFRLEASDTGRFVDVLAQAASKSNTNVRMLGDSFRMAAPIAGALNYSVEDVALSLGLMANAGIKSTMSGRSLRQAMTNLAGGVTLTSDALGKYKYSSMDADGTSKDLKQVLDELRVAFSQMTQEEQVANAETIAAKTGMSGLLAIVNASQEEYDSLANSIANSSGRAEEMAKIMRDNLKGDMTLAKSAVDGLAQSFGETLEPAARGLVQAFTGIIDKFMGLSETSKSTIIAITTIGTALGGLLLVAGTATMTFGKIFATLGKTAIGMKMSVGITSITKGLKTMIPVLGASKLAMSAFTLGIGAIAVALVGLGIHLATSEKRLREFNEKTIASMNESTEKIKQNTDDLKSVREAYFEIEELQNKINNTSNSSEKNQLEADMISKKQALIDLMPSVTEGMDAETTSQLELNRALDAYIKGKERENDLEQRKQRKEARDFISKNDMSGDKASSTLHASLTAEKNIQYVEDQLDKLSQYNEDTKLILANGSETTVKVHRKNLEARLNDSTKAFEKENTLLQQTYDAYSVLDPKTLRPEQKAFMEEFEQYDNLIKSHKSNLEGLPELDFDTKRLKSSKTEIQALKDELEGSKESFSSFSSDANDSFGKMIERIDAGKMTVEDFRSGLFEFESAGKKAYGQNGALAKSSMDKVIKAFSNGELTLEEYSNAIKSTTSISEDSLRGLTKSGKENMISLMKTFERGDIPVQKLAKSIDLMSTYGTLNFEKLSDNGKKSMEHLASNFSSGTMSVEDFEGAVGVMSTYTAQDFSKLDKASKKTLDDLITKLPEGGNSVQELENAISGMTARNSIDMASLDQNTQNTINSIVSKFNEGEMTSQSFADAMNIMSLISKAGLDNLNEGTKNAILTLQSEFAKGNLTADEFANGLMNAMGIAGVSLSQFTSEGQGQLLSLIGQFLEGKISAEKLQVEIDSLKTNPDFATNVSATMQSVSDSANIATRDVSEVKTEINNVPTHKTSTIEINTVRTTVDRLINSTIPTLRPPGKQSISLDTGVDTKGKTASPTETSGEGSTTAKSPSYSASESSSPTVELSPEIPLIDKTNSNSRASQSDEEKQAEAARKQLNMEQNAIREIEVLRDKLAESLRKKAEKQKEYELKLLDEKINAIEKHYDKQKELLDKSINDKIEALEKEKKALNGENEEDYQGKVDALKSELDMWKQNDSAYAKGKVKELEEKLKEAEKDLRNKQIDDEIDRLKEEQNAQEKALEEQQRAEVDALEKEKEAKEKYWEEQLSDKNIFLEANKILLQGNMNEMLTLIETYAPEWDDIGLLFGESLADGIKRGIKDGLNAKDFMSGLRNEYEESNPSWETQKKPTGGTTNNSSASDAQTKRKGKVVGTDSLNVRDGAGTNFKQSGILWRNEEIEILDEKNGWYYIDYYNATKKSRQKGWSSGNYIQRFNTGGVVGDLGLNGGIAIVDSKERILTAQQTDSFDKLVYDWIPNLENMIQKFNNLKLSDSNFNNNVTVKNEWNIENKTPFDVKKTEKNIEQVFRAELRKYGKLKK